MLETEQVKIELMKQRIRNLSRDYIPLIKRITEWERIHPEHKFGWQMEDIEGMTGGHINHLQKNGVITRGYYSRQYHHYALTEHWSIVLEAVELIEEEDANLKSQPSKLLENVVVTDEDIAEFKDILANNDAIKYWTPYVCPKVVEMEKQKEAILIALASHWDEHGDRWRINILMYGKKSSGTGKTPLLRWVKVLGGGYASGTRSTKSGLTVNLKDGSPGFLPRYHRSVVGIDELDKADKHDRDGILDAAELGIIPYEAGEHSGEYPAETIIIAAANDVSFFSPEQFGRFDFRFHIKEYKVDEAKTISHHRSMTMGKPKEHETERLLKFLKWIRGREAYISDEVRKQGAELINKYIEYTRKTDIRHLEAIWRVARAIARLNYRDVEVRDVERAIGILAKCYDEGE